VNIRDVSDLKNKRHDRENVPHWE